MSGPCGVQIIDIQCWCIDCAGQSSSPLNFKQLTSSEQSAGPAPDTRPALILTASANNVTFLSNPTFFLQPSEPRLGQIYVFTRNGLTPLQVQSPVSSIISQFSQQIESGIRCCDQKMILHHARQSPLSLSAILNLFQHKNTGFNLSPLCVHWAGRGGGLPWVYPCSVSRVLRSSARPQVTGTALEWKNPRFQNFMTVQFQ